MCVCSLTKELHRHRSYRTAPCPQHLAMARHTLALAALLALLAAPIVARAATQVELVFIGSTNCSGVPITTNILKADQGTACAPGSTTPCAPIQSDLGDSSYTTKCLPNAFVNATNVLFPAEDLPARLGLVRCVAACGKAGAAWGTFFYYNNALLRHAMTRLNASACSNSADTRSAARGRAGFANPGTFTSPSTRLRMRPGCAPYDRGSMVSHAADSRTSLAPRAQ